jgi:hypothetical protein
MLIGELEKLTNTPARSLRYYEAQGLAPDRLPHPEPRRHRQLHGGQSTSEPPTVGAAWTLGGPGAAVFPAGLIRPELRSGYWLSGPA